MEVADAAGVKLAAQFGSDGRRNQLARRRQVVEAFEQLVEPLRDGSRRRSGRSAASSRRSKPAGCPGTISTSIPAAAASSRKRKKQSGEKKNCVIARSAPASTLRFRFSRSNAAGRRVRMHFGIGGDRNVERRDLLQAGDEFGGIAIAVRVRLIFRPGLRRVAAQRDDVANAELPIFARNVVDLIAARADAGEVRGRCQRGFLEDPLDRLRGCARGSSRRRHR